MSVLFVCLGNICRSPLAQGVFEKVCEGKRVVVDSAGTAGYHVGSPPDSRSIEVARQHGVDISQQKARHLCVADFDRFHLIVVMDRSNLADVNQLRKQADKNPGKAKVVMFGDVAQGTSPGRGPEVPDPYYGSLKDFEEVFQMLTQGSSALLNLLNTLAE